MKYIKEYNEYIDPYQEDWEVEEEPEFITWLKREYPDESKWNEIKTLYCSNNNLDSLEGIGNLTNLESLYCSNNQLTSLEGIENLTSLKELFCFNNFSNEYIDYIKDYCKKHKIYLNI